VKAAFPAFVLNVIFVVLAFAGGALPQTTTFTYQGRGTDSANPGGNASYDMQFRLWDGHGTQQGPTITNPTVQVVNYLFTVQLDFGSAPFASGANLYLEVSICPAGSQSGYSAPGPRKQITSGPYAVRALNAGTADNLSGNLTGDVTGTQSATVVGTVGGKSAAQVSASVDDVTNAANANTANTLVRRDGSGGSNIGLASITNACVSITAPAPDIGEALRVTTNDPTYQTTLSGLLVRFRSNTFNSTASTDKFRFDNASGFVALGVLGAGLIPASGAGERMMWHPYKAAFPVGSIGAAGTQWDDANVGFYTFATGYNTTALGLSSVSAGRQSSALGSYSTAFGFTGIADGTASVALGYRSSAVGDYNTVLGQRGRTGCRTGDLNCTTPFSYTGSFVFSDASTVTTSTTFDATANNQFAVRAAGGFRFRTNTGLTAGRDLPAGSGVFSCTSSRTEKENFANLSGADILRRLRRIPVIEWSYKSEAGGVRHIGAFAEDFYREFKLGTNEKEIGLLDVAGVSIAAAKELDSRVTALQAENNSLKKQMQTQQADIEALKTLVCAKQNLCRLYAEINIGQAGAVSDRLYGLPDSPPS
jgi:trimeric autotransporter adhesin